MRRNTNLDPHIMTLTIAKMRTSLCLMWIVLVMSPFILEVVGAMDMEDDSTESAAAAAAMDPDEFDDRTLLDTFGEAAKQYITQKLIPKTDAECKWDWRTVRCEPFCECDFVLKRGDYHLGRACRTTKKDECDPASSVPAANSVQLVIQRVVQGSQKVVNTAGNRARTGYQKVQGTVCDKMPELSCSEELPVIAWQERLLCRHKIPDCPENENAGAADNGNAEVPDNDNENAGLPGDDYAGASADEENNS
jgi:hypothetical protein